MTLSRRALLLPAPLAAFPSGNETPSFRAKSLDGQTFNNAAVKGKPVLIQLWATWCGYCRRDQPDVDDAAELFADQGLVVLAVNVGESRAKVRDYLQRSPRKGHIILTADTNLATLFKGDGLPHYVMLDREGKVVKERTGAGGARGLAALLSAAGVR